MKRKQPPIFSALEKPPLESVGPGKTPESQAKAEMELAVAGVGAEVEPEPAPRPDISRRAPSTQEGDEPRADLNTLEIAPPSKPLRFSAEFHDFGGVLLGNQGDWQLTIYNDNEETCQITEVLGLPAHGFGWPDPLRLPISLPPQSSQVLKVRFSPDSAGNKMATFAIATPAINPEAFKVLLTGMGIDTIHTPEGVLYSPIPNSLGMSFVYIPAGTFWMGSPEPEPGRNRDEALHEVTLTKGFYLQTTPVTQRQWQAVMGNTASSFVNISNNCPVEQVSWHDCQEFINRLNSSGEGSYRLPKEAEWEYACRAGNPAAFTQGEITSLFCDHDPILDNLGWYCGNSERHTHPVAEKSPNDYGLYDVHGNVCEWCQDWYGEDLTGLEEDPTGPGSGSKRVIRGGSWFSSAKTCRSASRFAWAPKEKAPFIGVRLVREV